MKLRQRSRLSVVAAMSATALIGGALVAAPAGALTQTRLYLVAADVSGVSVAGSAAAVTLTNCGAATVGCPLPSTQSIKSFDITMPTGWTAAPPAGFVSPAGWSVFAANGGSSVQVRSTGGAVAPGSSFTVGLVVTPLLADAGITRTVATPADASATLSGNDAFTLVGNPVQLTVGGAYLQLSQQPHGVQVRTSQPAPCDIYARTCRDQVQFGYEAEIRSPDRCGEREERSDASWRI